MDNTGREDHSPFAKISVVSEVPVLLNTLNYYITTTSSEHGK
jgi:hypothetical protein